MRANSSISKILKSAAILVSAFSIAASAQKPWKGAENITTQTFKYGAFETRLKSAKGGGLITTFFLWKNGSEVPGNLWQEMDFEIFGRDGSFQSQIMTPGKVAGDQRTEHVKMHYPTTAAHDRYNTYRMEWTPDSICFYYNGYLIRKETDKVEFAKLMDPAQAEAMQLRVGVWAGDYEWSGLFDSTAIPSSNYANWLQTYSYTPGTGPGGSNFTPLWRDDFDSWNGSRWWKADWTFSSAINDYVSTNSAVRDGMLQSAFTHWSQMGTFLPTPVDDGKLPPIIEALPVDSTPFSLPGAIALNRFVSSYDNTVGNSGTGSCRSTSLDVDMKQDPADPSSCFVSSTAAGEWLEYRVNTPVTKRFDIAAMLGTTYTTRKIKILLDGVKVGTSLEPLANGWTAWNEVVFRGITIPAGTHSLRLVMETGNTNVKSLTVREWDPVVALPGRIPAEAYVAYNDLTVGNSGGACRQDDVDLQTSSDIGGGCQLSSTQAGEWVDYSTKFAEAGWYELSLRLASAYTTRTAKVFVDGVQAAQFTAPANGWQVFSSVVSAPVAVTAGAHTIRIQFVTGNTNTHFLDVTKLTGLPPQMVSGLVGVANNGSVELTWSASVGATSYKVVRGTDTVATVTGTAYQDATVVNGTTYTYSVVAVNSFGAATASSSVSVTPKVPEPPAGPTNLVGLAGDARVDLSWSAVSGATSYNVYRSTDAVTFTKVASVANAQYLDATVQNGATYSYFVTMLNESIKGLPESKPSDTVDVSPRGSVPAKVTGLVAVGDDSKIALSWTPSVGATAYTIYRGVGDAAKVLLTVVSAPSYLDEAVANGVAYSYLVVASNVWGEGLASDAVSAAPVATPQAPVALVATAGNGTVSLSWIAGLNNSSFNVYRAVGAEAAVKIATGVLVNSYTDASVVNGTSYVYTVTGLNGTKESVASNPASALPDSPAPEAPSGLVAIAGEAKVTLNWAAGLNDLSYNVYRGLVGGEAPVKIASGVTTTTLVDISAVPGTDYVYTVTGVNGAKESSVSNEATARPDFATPEAPLALSATAGNGKVSLAWTAGLNDLSYNVYRAVLGGDAPVKIASGVIATSLTDLSVVAGTEYVYTVTGVNGTKESSPSNSASAFVGAPPAQVTGIVASAGDAVVNLNWSASVGASSYQVLRAAGNGVLAKVADVAVAGYQDLSVTNGVQYTYAIIAVNSYGEATVSASVVASPDFATPSAPSALTAIAGNGTVALSWVAGTNNALFNVYRSTAGSTAVRIATGSTLASFTDATVVNGTEYTYSVTGLNGTKESIASNLAIALPRGEAPAQVTGLVATAGNATVALSWAAAARATSYKVVRGTDTLATVTGIAYADNAVVNGTTYTYSIVASNVWGNATVSASASAKPSAPTASLKAQYKAGFVGASTNGIRPLLQVVNTGTTAVPLSQVTVRYWFTNDGAQSNSYWCDWAQIGQANITGSFKTPAQAKPTADRYLELAFSTTAGSLAPGASTGEIQSRFSKNDWSNFTQTNDASYDPTKSTSYVDWTGVTVYVGGNLVWGTEP